MLADTNDMIASEVFKNLEWQVARVRRATERYKLREEDKPGSGRVLLDHVLEDLDQAVEAWVEAGRHAND